MAVFHCFDFICDRYSETLHPFERLIHPEEWWLYKNTHAPVHTVSTAKLYVS